MGYVPLRKKKKPSMLSEVATYGIRSVMRHFLKYELHAFVAVLVVPPLADIVVYHDAVISLLRRGRERGEYDFDDWRVEFVDYPDQNERTEQLRRVLPGERTVILLRERCELPKPLALAADLYADIPEPTPIHFMVAARQCGIPEMTKYDATFLSQRPFKHIGAAMGIGRPYLTGLRRLRRLENDIEFSATEPPPLTCDLSKLDQVVGHAEIKAWAASVAEDIIDWREQRLEWCDIDKGAVICGPSGTGKTRLANLIAEACGVNLISTSAAKWQSKGHLGDYLKAMRSVFEEAAKKSPCILFIDEIDAVGDRARLSGDNENYVRQAINGLLEVMDGSDGRDGVVVIGATNDVSVLDPALLRPGRLERVFHVGLPDAGERQAILRHHLAPLSLPDDLGQFGEVSEGMSGADIEMVARNAKRLVRRSGRDITVDDIWTSMPPLRRLEVYEIGRNAVHEIGHAIVGLKLGIRNLVSVSVVEFLLVGGSTRSLGQTRFESATFAARGRQQLLDEIAMLMGGIAAEELVLGAFTDGAGGMRGSDLVTATDIATILECQLGMGGTMTSEVSAGAGDLRSMRQLNPLAWRRIDETVRAEYERAKSLIQEAKADVARLAAELVKRKRMTGDEVRQMLAETDRPRMQ